MRLLLPSLLLACVASGLSAAPAKPRANAIPPAPPPVRLFISPMGEPFRPDAHPDPLAAWFTSADADANGALTHDELRRDASRFFRTLDADADGEIEPSEMTRYETEVAPEIQLGRRYGDGLGPRPAGLRGSSPGRGKGERPRGGGRKRGPRGPDGAGQFSILDIPQPVAAADADLNRGVSLAEFLAAADQRLVRIDRNRDGAVTRDELSPPPPPLRKGK